MPWRCAGREVIAMEACLRGGQRRWGIQRVEGRGSGGEGEEVEVCSYRRRRS